MSNLEYDQNIIGATMLGKRFLRIIIIKKKHLTRQKTARTVRAQKLTPPFRRLLHRS